MAYRRSSSKAWTTRLAPVRPLSSATDRAGNRLRLLLWDGNGVWLCQRRLHQGGFVWPKADEVAFAISQAQWRWLIAGVDWQRLSAKPSSHWQV